MYSCFNGLSRFGSTAASLALVCSFIVPISAWGNSNKIHLNRYDGNSHELQMIAPTPEDAVHRNSSILYSVVVKSPDNTGIVAVIQKMDLPWLDSAQCLIEIKVRSAYGSGSTCGTLDKKDRSVDPVGLYGPRIFTTSMREMTVTLETRSPSDYAQVWANVQFVRGPTIAFTAYKRAAAAAADYKSYISCAYEGGSKFVDYNIRSSNLCDGILNCPGDENTFGIDEDVNICEKNGKSAPVDFYTPVSPKSSPKSMPPYAVGIVLFLVLLLFSVLLLGRLCRDKATSTCCPAGSNGYVQGQSTITLTPPWHVNPSMPQWTDDSRTVPSAPPISRDSSDDSRDLPPSYPDELPPSYKDAVGKRAQNGFGMV